MGQLKPFSTVISGHLCIQAVSNAINDFDIYGGTTLICQVGLSYRVPNDCSNDDCSGRCTCLAVKKAQQLNRMSVMVKVSSIFMAHQLFLLAVTLCWLEALCTCIQYMYIIWDKAAFVLSLYQNHSMQSSKANICTVCHLLQV